MHETVTEFFNTLNVPQIVVFLVALSFFILSLNPF